MPFARWRVLLTVLALAGPAAAQPPAPPPPAAVLGEPGVRPPLFDINNPLAPLGPPDQPFRPFAPLGPPATPATEGIGTKFGLGILAGRFGLPGYGLNWAPAQPVAGQPTDLGMVRQNLSLFAPIYREGADTAAIGVGISNSLFSTNAILPDSNRPFPSSLWDIQAGALYAHQWDNGWTTGVAISAGSASDRPFANSNILANESGLFGSYHVLVANVTAYNAFPAEGRDAWVVGVNYASMSDFPYPLPIAFYYWEPSADVQVGLGVPFFLRWRFLPNWTAEALWIPIRNVSAQVTWNSPDQPGLRAYGAFAWTYDTYFLADRIHPDDRFFYFEKRLYGGLQFDLPYQLRLDLAAGYSFDREFFQARSYGENTRDRVKVGAGVFGMVQLRLRF